MKRVLVAVALGVLTGCPDRDPVVDAGVPDAGPRVLVDKEPNDQPENAVEVTGTSVVNGTLSSDPTKPDEDWFSLSATDQQVADLTLGPIPGVDAKLEVLDVDRNLLVAVNTGGEGKEERLPNLAVRERIFVRVVSAKKGSGGSYTLQIVMRPAVAGEELEPNDRAVDAIDLPFGQSLSATLAHAGDSDWVRLELPAQEAAASTEAPLEQDAGSAELTATDADAGDAEPQKVPPGQPVVAEPPRSVALKIDLSGIPEVALEVQVLSAAEAPLFTIKGEPGASLSLRNIGVRESDRVVYLVIKSGWTGVGKDAKRGFSPEVPYTLTVTQEEAGANAELEPNDEVFKATPLPENGFRQGFLSPKTDLDYFVIRPAEPSLIRAQLSGVDRVDLVLSVIQPASEDGSSPEKVLLRANDGAIKEPEYLNSIFCAEACYLKVEAGVRKVAGKWVRDFENAEMGYRLAVTSSPDTGAEEREPNGTAENATPVGFGGPVRGTVYPKKDSDLYRLDLTGRPVRTPLRATLLGILKVDVGLYLHRVQEDGSLTLVQTADRAKGEAPENIRYSAEPGMYVFEVRDSKSRESNFQDSYQLTVEEGE
ncbi:MAG: ABC transporter substrate-binding protein [Myxococcota bacterium]|nr:ABC transporter substrate-binding protein [Myxococcota bacterium]